MFKKYYKEANDDIKPSEEFISDVIKKAKKGKPPAYKRYAKYAAAAAAAVIVVSGAVLSMPMWKSVDEDNGVIFEETTDSKAPSSPSPDMALQTPLPDQSDKAENEGQKEKSNNIALRQQSPTSKPQSNTAKPNTRAGTVSSFNSAAHSQEAKKTEETNKAENTHEEERASDISEGNAESNPQPTAAEEAGAKEMNKGESTEENSVVADSADIQTRAYKAPEDTAVYEEKRSFSAAQADKGISDSDIPAPTGYYCVSATARGYTFQNDEGAVIEVTISYGGEEREPYIEEDGDSIYAVFTSYGMSVTINAYGARRVSVEEIINQLR